MQIQKKTNNSSKLPAVKYIHAIPIRKQEAEYFSRNKRKKAKDRKRKYCMKSNRI